MKYFSSIFIILFILLHANVKADDTIKYGMILNLFADSQWKEVLTLSKKWININIKSAEDQQVDGILYSFHSASKKTNQEDKAKNFYIALIQENPKNYHAWFYLGNYYRENHEWEKSIDAYKNVVDLKPDYYSYFFLTAWDYIHEASKEINQEGKIANFYIEQTQENPQNYDAWFQLGVYYSENEEWEKSINAYKETLRIEPDHAWALLNLGFSYTKEKQWELAINPLTKGLESFSEHGTWTDHAWLILAISYYETGQLQMVNQTLREAINHNPDNLQAKTLLQSFENE